MEKHRTFELSRILLYCKHEESREENTTSVIEQLLFHPSNNLQISQEGCLERGDEVHEMQLQSILERK